MMNVHTMHPILHISDVGWNTIRIEKNVSRQVTWSASNKQMAHDLLLFLSYWNLSHDILFRRPECLLSIDP